MKDATCLKFIKKAFNKFFCFLQKIDYKLLVHCVKSVRIRSYSGLYFPVFGLNKKRYGVSLVIQAKCEKIRTRKTPNTDTFYSVIVAAVIVAAFLAFSFHQITTREFKKLSKFFVVRQK